MQFDTGAVLFAFALTLFAGLSTGIGSAIALFTKRTNTKFLSVALGFSAGVMIYVSMIEMFFEAKDTLTTELGYKPGYWVTVAAFFGGMLIIAIIDKLVPEAKNPHDMKSMDDIGHLDEHRNDNKLMRMGLLTAIAIAVHNFPEGIATFVAALKDPSIGIAIAIAIAIHNIPEGIAVSVPIYYATGDKKKAFRMSFLSGLAEPLGAIVGFFILMPFMNDVIFGIIFAAVAGIMVFISVDGLLPASREYGEAHLSIYGLVSGMVVMAISLILLS